MLTLPKLKQNELDFYFIFYVTALKRPSPLSLYRMKSTLTFNANSRVSLLRFQFQYTHRLNSALNCVFTFYLFITGKQII